VFILGPAFHVAAVVLDVVIRLLEREP
jgi:hypothetical protein